MFKKSLQILPLLLFLLTGQLQAQPDLSCSLTMDMSSSEINHNSNKSCPDSDNGDSPRPNAPVFDLVLELDIDPSEEELTAYNSIIQSQDMKLISSFTSTNYYHAGTKIHLLTQRLRI